MALRYDSRSIAANEDGYDEEASAGLPRLYCLSNYIIEDYVDNFLLRCTCRLRLTTEVLLVRMEEC